MDVWRVCVARCCVRVRGCVSDLSMWVCAIDLQSFMKKCVCVCVCACIPQRRRSEGGLPAGPPPDSEGGATPEQLREEARLRKAEAQRAHEAQLDAARRQAYADRKALQEKVCCEGCGSRV